MPCVAAKNALLAYIFFLQILTKTDYPLLKFSIYIVCMWRRPKACVSKLCGTAHVLLLALKPKRKFVEFSINVADLFVFAGTNWEIRYQNFNGIASVLYFGFWKSFGFNIIQLHCNCKICFFKALCILGSMHTCLLIRAFAYSLQITVYCRITEQRHSISYNIVCAPMKTQIELHIRAVCSEFSLSTCSRFGSLVTHKTPFIDSYQC